MFIKIFSKKMLITFIMGFASGLPLLLTLSTLQAWMKEVQVDLGKIGLISLIGLPYSWKFLWAPLFDRFVPPFLGRRRGWLFIIQILLVGCIFLMGLFNPREQLWGLSLTAVLVAFFSASQDIIIDSYRREYLSDEELGLGSSVYVYGYRIAMLLSSGGSLILADRMSWSQVYAIMALCLLPTIACTLWCPEPTVSEKLPSSFRESVVEPFTEFFQRSGAWLILGFILCYKLGDVMASAMTMPFYLDLGYSKTEIGAITKLFGFWATIFGTFLGGVILLKWKLQRSLFLFGWLQCLSTFGFALLALYGVAHPSLSPALSTDFNWSIFVRDFRLIGLTSVVLLENLSGGMGTAAFMAYMATQTNKKFTATQFALFTSLMGVPRTLLAAPTGYMANAMGWLYFFIFCAVIAIPGIIMIKYLDHQGAENFSRGKGI